MYVLDGQWYMQGLDRDDEGCIRSSGELLSVIESVGFLPLFSNSVAGFSVEEMTAVSDWWSGDEDIDPWEWRAVLARTDKVAYGKFFGIEVTAKRMDSCCVLVRKCFCGVLSRETDLASAERHRLLEFYVGMFNLSRYTCEPETLSWFNFRCHGLWEGVDVEALDIDIDGVFRRLYH